MLENNTSVIKINTKNITLTQFGNCRSILF